MGPFYLAVMLDGSVTASSAFMRSSPRIETMQPNASATVVTFDQAMSLVMSHAAKASASGPVETVPLLNSRGRVIANPVIADRNQPPFDRSTRDGFAARAADLADEKPLRLTGVRRAGDDVSSAELQPGEAIEIMTGAAVPAGADCVAMVEHTQVNEGIVRLIARLLQPGDNVVREGSEARRGDLLLPAGTRMSAAEIAVAAACGFGTLQVFPRPTVAILATGDELVDVAEQPLLHQIRNSNSYALAAQVAEAGGEPQRLPIVRDALSDVLAAIDAACDSDLILLSGGVSMGKYDFVEEALAARGAEFFFTGVRMQPGKPVVFGLLPGRASGKPRYFFGLPGNPISTQLTFQLFVRPLLLALCGARERQTPFVQAMLKEPVSPKPGLTRFLPARVEHLLTGPRVTPVAWQGSGDQTANARANCYLVVPESARPIDAGSHVSLLLR